jgi:predicted phosphodiesterase
MRIGLISDIHGNTVALDAVLTDMNRYRTDVTVCLGDIAAGGPDPGGAVDRIAELGCVAVQGNTDAGWSTCRPGGATRHRSSFPTRPFPVSRSAYGAPNN